MAEQTRKFTLGCRLSYSLAEASTFIFNIGVAQNVEQKILQEELQIEPALNYQEYIWSQVENRYLRFQAPSGNLQVSYQALVEISCRQEQTNPISEVPIAELPCEILHYLYPSRYCESDRLLRLARHEFSHLLPGYSRVTAICNWIYNNVTYLSGSTDPHTSAYDTATEKAGVCRDFAHLGIAFCRALNIPARFVTGYAYGLEPPDFHAYFEAYLGNCWYRFDPSRLVSIRNLIRIGIGRDAADVSFATIFGTAQMEQMNLFIEPI